MGRGLQFLALTSLVWGNNCLGWGRGGGDGGGGSGRDGRYVSLLRLVFLDCVCVLKD